MTYTEWIDGPAVIEVTGKGRFPMDMLRHDCAWPADGDSAYAINPEQDRDYHKFPRTVRLVVKQRRFFTPDRWASFGWDAVDLDPEGYVDGL